MMEVFLHYITADIKYNFWCEEDGHQFREDWVRCRINVKYIDSPNIQINCYPVNHYEVIPLQVDIKFADFRFEKVVEVNGTKANVFALLWMQHDQISEFHIAIDDGAQFKSYESYLNNLMKICRIAESERLDAQTVEPSSISYENVGSTISLFSTSAYGAKSDKSASTESIAKKENEKLRSRFSRVKNATKFAAKKFNQMFVEAKSKLIKPLSQMNSHDISGSSSDTRLTDVSESFYQTADEFEEIDLNEASKLFSRTMNVKNFDLSNTEETLLNTSTISTSSSSSTSSSLMHQIFESIAEFNMIYIKNRTPMAKQTEERKPFRKGTPFKLKMPQRLTLCEENVPPAPETETEVAQVEEASNEEDYDFCIDAVDLTVPDLSNENTVDSEPKSWPISYFPPEESLGKRVSEICRQLWKTVLDNQELVNSSPSAHLFHY